MIKIFNYFLQSIIVYFFFFIGKILGLNLSRKIFSYIFKIIGPTFRSKRLIESNIKNFSKNLSNEEIKKISNSMWKNYGMTFIEYVFLNYLRKNNSHVKVENVENLQNLMKKNKSIIFVSGHFANYELMSMEMTKRKIKLATIYRQLNNFFLNPFMEYLRKKYVCEHQIQKGINGVREAIEYIKKDFSIALMIDQRVSEGESVNFFNKSALTTTLPAQLSIKYNLPIVPVFIKRVKEKKFEIKFLKEVLPENFSDKIEMTEKLNYILEDMIIKNPDQWIWTHNRWK